MLSPPIIGLIIFAVIMVGAFAGWAARRYLRAHHLTDETKSLVSVSMAVLATVSALVLGLLLSNANNLFIARGGEVTGLSADLLRLDHMLDLYGPEADPARYALQQYAKQKMDDLFPPDSETVRFDNPSSYRLLQRVECSVLALQPSDSRHQWLVGQAMTLGAKIGNTRWLLAQESTQGTPKAFLGLVVFWLTLLFASFALFAPHNVISALALMLCALAVSGAVYMILELETPFGGLIRLSPVSMHRAVDALNQFDLSRAAATAGSRSNCST